MPTPDPSQPLKSADVRPWPLKASDPLGVLVGGIFLAASSAGLFSLLDWTGDQVAGLQSGLLMIAAAVRWYLEQRNAGKVAAMADQREAAAHRTGLLKPQPQNRVERRGARGEGGKVLEPVEDAPTDPKGAPGALE